MTRCAISLRRTDASSLLRRAGALLALGMLGIAVKVAAYPLQQAPEQPASAEADTTARATIENLRAFAKLYGYVRYFHPSDAASAIDWERFAVHGAREVEGAAGPDELKGRLEALFLPIAPTIVLYETDARPPAPAPVLVPEDTSGLELVAWQHRGVGLGNPGPYRSIRLHRSAEESPEPTSASVWQRIDAAPYRGKTIRLSAAVKADVNGDRNQAHLSLYTELPDGQPGFFESTEDRPIIRPSWATYTITGAVGDDADTIGVGGMLLGSGKAWFDDVQLLVRDSDKGEWSSVPLENAGFEAGAADEKPTGWRGGAPGYELAMTDEAADEGELSLVITSAEQVVQMAQPLFAERPEAGAVAERELGRGLAVQIPLALYSRDGQTLRPDDAPPLDALEAELQAVALGDLTAEDAALRYADVVIAWNVFQHFYPYFDVAETDWDHVLTETLERAGEDESAEDFLQTLRWMVAQLDDGHADVVHQVTEHEARPPLLVDEVEGEIMIVAVGAFASGERCFSQGDIVVSIDGVVAAAVVRASEEYVSGSPQWKRRRALREFGRGERGTVARLVLDRGGETLSCDVVRSHQGGLGEDRPRSLEELREGVYYVNFSTTPMAAIEEAAGNLSEADAIIFDLRGYTNRNIGVLQYLSGDTLRSTRWHLPQVIYPDQVVDLVGYDTTAGGRWTLPPREPQFTGRSVFLTDASAISQAESVLGIVEHYGLGDVVGQRTAGVTGGANPFTLPGGYRVFWTGARVVKHDGSLHHLVGIRPTVPVRRTVAGVRAGRDEFLEKALELTASSGASER